MILIVDEYLAAGPAARKLIQQNATQSMTRAECELLSLLFEVGVDYYESTMHLLWNWNIDEEPRQ